MSVDVTDATFQTEVIHKSAEAPVVIDLWAPWCGPCKTLTPTLEKVVDATGGQVVLAKVNIDENPGIARAFQVQSIPAVYAMRDGQIVDGFLGAQPERDVERFVDALLPGAAASQVGSLIDAGDEVSLRQAIELEPGNEDAVIALARLLVERGEFDEALVMLERIPESDRTRPIAAAARLGTRLSDDRSSDDQAADDRAPDPPAVDVRPADDYDATLIALLPKVKGDDEARQHYVDILELMGPDDPRTADYRKRLTRELF